MDKKRSQRKQTTAEHSSKGGLGSRLRRRRQRAATSSIYGPVAHTKIRYYKQIAVNNYADFKTSYYSAKISIGNKEIFSGAYSHLKVFHEYKLHYVDIRCVWQTSVQSTWAPNVCPEVQNKQVASLITDFDAPIGTKSIKLSWDQLCSIPGIKANYLSSIGHVTTRHRWRPTEPTDSDWRLTSNDGICYLYLFAHHLTHVKQFEDILATVSFDVNISLRAINPTTVPVLSHTLFYQHNDDDDATASQVQRLPSTTDIEAAGSHDCKVNVDLHLPIDRLSLEQFELPNT